MENASKALLIAGGMLIAILLLTLFTYLMRQTGESTASVYSTLSQSEISEFNQKFINFEGRGIIKNTSPLTVQDVATLINLAKDNNEKAKFPTEIAIYNGSKAKSSDLAKSENYIEWLDTNKTTNNTYKCSEVHINENSQLVDYVLIEQLP